MLFPSSHISYGAQCMWALVQIRRPKSHPCFLGAPMGFITFSSSGSQESSVRDRTLEQWTPKLLDRKRIGPRYWSIQNPYQPSPARVKKVYLWMPEHSMQSSTPRLMLAQRGSDWPQSPHWLLPATLCTRCSTLSPLTPRSRESVVESMLLVDGDAVRSSLWWTV